MIKINKKIVVLLALIILIIGILTNVTFAAGGDLNPDKYEPTGDLESGAFIARTGTVLGVIQYAGIIIAIVALVIIGLKFMFGSIEEKAEFKKTMVPYLVGCAMLVLVPTLVKFVATIEYDNNEENHNVRDVHEYGIRFDGLNLEYYCAYCHYIFSEENIKNMDINQLYDMIKDDKCPNPECSNLLTKGDNNDLIKNLINTYKETIISRIKDDNSKHVYEKLWGSIGNKKYEYNEKHNYNVSFSEMERIIYEMLVSSGKIKDKTGKPTVDAKFGSDIIYDEQEVICGFCGETLKNKDNILRTWNSEDKEAYCEQCKVLNINNIVKKIIEKTGCYYCTNNDNNYEIELSNMSIVEINEYLDEKKCPDCGAKIENYLDVFNSNQIININKQKLINVFIKRNVGFRINTDYLNDVDKKIIELCQKKGMISEDNTTTMIKQDGYYDADDGLWHEGKKCCGFCNKELIDNEDHCPNCYLINK